MGIGLGVVLIVAGAILLWALDWDIPFVDDDTLGLILLIVGIVALLVSLILILTGRRTTHVEERRYNNQ